MGDILHLIKLLKQYTVHYVVAIVFLIAGTLSFLMIPAQIGQMIGKLNELANNDVDTGIAFTVFLIAALLIGQAICTAIHAYIVANSSEQITNKLRLAFFSFQVSQPLQSVSTQKAGQVASEFASDLAIIQDSIANTMISFLRNVVASVGAFIALLLISIKITIITVVGILLVTMIIFIFIHFATKSIVQVQKYRANTVSLLLESSTNAYVIQAYHRQKYMLARFQHAIELSFSKVRKHLLLMAWVSPISLIIFAIIMAVTISYGIKEVVSQALSITDFVTYITYAVFMVATVGQVGMLFGRLKQGAAMYIKHQHRFETTLEGLSSKTLTSSNDKLGIVFENVNFSYPPHYSKVLKNLNINIVAGQTTALVGQSGAGKSTIAALLCGLFNPEQGQISLISQDGSTKCTYPPPENTIAIVPQEPFLFNGSFAENIAFGRENISSESIKLAAVQACIDGFIRTQAHGYETIIDEAGSNLSRGQRQRIAIARALVTNPKILILDEATASLDRESEKAIAETLNEIKGKITVVVIAHQGQLLDTVDSQILLEDGKAKVI